MRWLDPTSVTATEAKPRAHAFQSKDIEEIVTNSRFLKNQHTRERLSMTEHLTEIDYIMFSNESIQRRPVVKSIVKQ